jgi:hypothetical protein
MTAFHNMMLSGHGLPEMPPGGSLESRLKSRIRRLLQLVDYNQTRREQKIHGRDRQNELTMTVTGERWSLGTQQQRLFCLVPPPEIGQPSVTWSSSSKHFVFHGVSSLVSPLKTEDWFIFISGDECFHAKLRATGHPYLIL